MAKQKPQDSVGSKTGFPYSVLWEELAEWWEGFSASDRDVEKFEKLIEECAAAGHTLPSHVSCAAIGDLLVPLNLPLDKRDELASSLYRMAAAYLIPKVRKSLRRSPIDVERRLRSLAKKASALSDALENLDLEVEIVLGIHRTLIEAPTKRDSPIFNFKAMVDEARDLAKAASLMAEEIPRRAQGASVDLLQRGWVNASLKAVESAGAGSVEVLQADRFGRNPRPKGTPAEVLFAYLRLVDTKKSDATRVRLILELIRFRIEGEREWAKILRAGSSWD